jgi:hypothetical protein
MLTEVNMYLFCKSFPWCSPQVFREMSDWDKTVFMSILRGESKGDKMIEKQNNKKIPKGVGAKRGRVK